MPHLPSGHTPTPKNADQGAFEVDYTSGIYQSIGEGTLVDADIDEVNHHIPCFIGYKEFHDYLTSKDPSEKEFMAAVERMKQSTHRYAKRQVSWIRNKLLPNVFAANAGHTTNNLPCPTYLLDATGMVQNTVLNLFSNGLLPGLELGEKWASNVVGHAESLATGIYSVCLKLQGMTLLQHFWASKNSQIHTAFLTLHRQCSQSKKSQFRQWLYCISWNFCTNQIQHTLQPKYCIG
jgi:hypothetical protein